MRRPGIEPGSTAWKAAMLTIIPPTLICFDVSNIGISFSHHGILKEAMNVLPTTEH